MEDKAIIDLYVARDEQAIQCTKEKYGRRLGRLAYEILRDRQTAEECENDTYWKVWNAIPPHQPYDYFYAFLVRLVRNTALDRCRSRKNKASAEELCVELEDGIPGADNMEEEVDGVLLRDALDRFLATLPEEKRKVFVRRYWYMDSVKCIAEGYGMSESKVKSILFRCRNQLKQYLKKEGYVV